MPNAYNPLPTSEKQPIQLVTDFEIRKCLVKNVSRFMKRPTYPGDWRNAF